MVSEITMWASSGGLQIYLINCSFARNFILENMSELGEGGQKVPTSSYKISKSWDVMDIMVTIVNSTV